MLWVQVASQPNCCMECDAAPCPQPSTAEPGNVCVQESSRVRTSAPWSSFCSAPAVGARASRRFAAHDTAAMAATVAASRPAPNLVPTAAAAVSVSGATPWGRPKTAAVPARWVATAPLSMKVMVATTERTESLLLPQMPCPLVQPALRRAQEQRSVTSTGWQRTQGCPVPGRSLLAARLRSRTAANHTERAC